MNPTEGKPIVVNYANMRADKRKSLVRCPHCGRVGKVLRVPITRGSEAGKVRVSWTHQETRTFMGCYVRVENGQACYSWEPTPVPA